MSDLFAASARVASELVCLGTGTVLELRPIPFPARTAARTGCYLRGKFEF
jgi:hypothetical protein